MQLIQTKLVSEFNCLAADCPSTCCKEWNIIWRESEVKKLASCSNTEISNKISEAFCKDGIYYSIKHGEDGRCPFLLENGLCTIHKNVGEQYLSYVCREYPRITRVIGNIAIKSCKTACCEVMDKILNDKDCMETESTDSINIEAIITPENECSDRLAIFDNFFRRLWHEKLPYYNKEEIKRIFSDIFDFELIISDEENIDRKFCCENAESNLVKAVFLEWMINGYKPEFTYKVNLRCLDFCLSAARLAFDGAVKYSDSRSQLVMTMCDIVSFLLSNTSKIIMYLLNEN